MLEWHSIEFRILKLMLYSYTVYRVVTAGIGGQHGYPLLYAFQGIRPNKKARPLFFMEIVVSPLPYITLTLF